MLRGEVALLNKGLELPRARDIVACLHRTFFWSQPHAYRHTPVPNATRVMLLGAGELGKEVIIALQRLGVEVIAVDRYANAPGHQVAHHARSSTWPMPTRCAG
jgi:phosphoglycerate dehydrogenase-like enzyme